MLNLAMNLSADKGKFTNSLVFFCGLFYKFRKTFGFLSMKLTIEINNP